MIQREGGFGRGNWGFGRRRKQLGLGIESLVQSSHTRCLHSRTLLPDVQKRNTTLTQLDGPRPQAQLTPHSTVVRLARPIVTSPPPFEHCLPPSRRSGVTTMQVSRVLPADHRLDSARPLHLNTSSSGSSMRNHSSR